MKDNPTRLCGGAKLQPIEKLQSDNIRIYKQPWLGYHSLTFHMQSMKVLLLSINVRGIDTDTKLGVIREYIGSLSPKADVLCLYGN